MPISQDRLAKSPDCGGAYGLIICLKRTVTGAGPKAARGALQSGKYLYAGSANGPGGIRARVSRHAKRKKNLHWHIDVLTGAGRIVDIYAWPNLRECEIIDACLAVGGGEIALPGFGSSDCRCCAAHLIKLTPDFDPSRLEPHLGKPQRI